MSWEVDGAIFLQLSQVYQTTTKRFLCRNKLYGRSLSVSGFTQALCKFLHNGKQVRVDVLPPLIRKLEELLGVLHRQEAVRFYTASLLLLYEGLDVSDISQSQNFQNGKFQFHSEVLICVL